MTQLHIFHFNDVYRVTKQKLQSGKTIDVSQFAEQLASLRKGDDLLLFSGDVFSPSVESTVTRGSHMVPVMNLLAPDVSLTGNHDFDFGYPHLCKLINDCKFPWILSNVIDSRTQKNPEGLQRFVTFDRAGVKIGVIGLVEKNWITTVPAWPQEFEYRDVNEVALELSKELRDPNGEHKCDIIIALTHARLPNDIEMAQSLLATSDIKAAASQHGVDLVMGGHDHTYYIGKGVDGWEGYTRNDGELGTEKDTGVRLIKSGTDFRDLSEMTLEIEDAPAGSVRRRLIKSIKGARHQTTPELPSSKAMSTLLTSLLSDVSKSLSAPLCVTLSEWDVRSEVVRLDESAVGNWMADVLLHTYDDAISSEGQNSGGADGVLICGGTLRGDSRYGPGVITLGDILEILPFEDPAVVIEVDGKSLWDVMESSLSMFPSQEGRFPIVSGMRVEWDSRKPPGQRVVGIWQIIIKDNGEDAAQVKEEPIKRENGGRRYKIVTRQYMYEGHDGCEALMNKPCLVDEESGLIMSTIIRKFLLGSQYIHKLKQLTTAESSNLQHNDRSRTLSAIARARAQWKKVQAEGSQPAKPDEEPGVSPPRLRWIAATAHILHASQDHSHGTIRNALRVGEREHMSEVDQFDGSGARAGRECKHEDYEEGKKTQTSLDLISVKPVIDGRMKDLARVKA